MKYWWLEQSTVNQFFNLAFKRTLKRKEQQQQKIGADCERSLLKSEIIMGICCICRLSKKKAQQPYNITNYGKKGLRAFAHCICKPPSIKKYLITIFCWFSVFLFGSVINRKSKLLTIQHDNYSRVSTLSLLKIDGNYLSPLHQMP